MPAPQYEQAGADIGGTGTANTIPRWTGASTLGDSGLIDNGTAIYTTTRNAGIGTASPVATAKLTLGGAANSTIKMSYQTGGTTEVAFDQMNTATGEFRHSSGVSSGWGGSHTFYTDTTEKVRITSDGNVGIGTASPTDSGGWSAGRILDVRSPSAGSSSVAYFGDSSRSTNMQIGFYGSGYGFVGTVTNHALSLRTGNTERVQIDTSGQIFRWNTFTDSSNYKGTRLSSATYSGAEYSTLSVVGIGAFAASNIGLVLQPLGTGAITAQMPDGTATGGNARGANAVDLQTARGSAAQVASGAYSIAAGTSNTASNQSAVALGQSNTASGTASAAIGDSNTASASRAVAIGQSNTASGANATAIGSGNASSGNCSVALGQASSASGTASASIGSGTSASASYSIALGAVSKAYLRGQLAVAGQDFIGIGDAQKSSLVPLRITTNATPTNLTLDAAALVAGNALTLPNNTAWAADVHIVARSATGAGHAYFVRRVLIKRDANAASAAIVGTVQTIGTDIGSNAGAPPAGWAVAITADTTNGALDIQVTGALATTINWVARVELVEVGLA